VGLVVRYGVGSGRNTRIRQTRPAQGEAIEGEEVYLRHALRNDRVPEGTPPLGRRVFRTRTVVSFLLAFIVLYLVYRQVLGLDWREVWATTRGTNVGLLVLSFAVFYCSYLFRALRWRALLENVGYGQDTARPIPSTLGLVKIMYLAWFANCITVARVGDAYRGYLLKRATGISLVVTLGTVLAERLLDLMILVAMLAASALTFYRGALPPEVAQTLAVGLVLSIVGIVGLLSMGRLRWVVERVLPKGLHAHYARLEHGTVSSFRRVPLLAAYSVIGWVIEGSTLYLTATAVGAPITVAGALLVALVAALLTAVPLTPGGLGFTEAGMVLLLQGLGLDAPSAAAVTLLFRLINYWSIVGFGTVLYAFSLRDSVKARSVPSGEESGKP
jgi:uncharacterized protein (TIRG00374 family)